MSAEVHVFTVTISFLAQSCRFVGLGALKNNLPTVQIGLCASDTYFLKESQGGQRVSYVIDTKRALEIYLETPATWAVFEQLQAQCPELRSFDSLAELIAFFRDQDQRGKNAVLQALLSAYAEQSQFVFFVVALVMLPGLLLLIRFFLEEGGDTDDLWGDILYQFRLTLEEQVTRRACTTARLKWGTFDRLLEQRASHRLLEKQLHSLRLEIRILGRLAERHLRDVFSQDSGEELSPQEVSLVLRRWVANQTITPQRAHLLFQFYAQGSSSAQAGGMVGASDEALRKRKERVRSTLSQDTGLQALRFEPIEEEEP
jgi:hypothetical protein